MTFGEHVSSDSRVAFGDYVRMRGGPLLRTALSLTGNNRADAEDLVQATLVKTYLSWDKISDSAALDTYVRRVMVNTHISCWRRRRVDEYPTDELPDEPVSGQMDNTELHEVVQQALDRLPRQMRAAVMLRYYDDMSEPEVARALGVSVGTVKSTVARAVAKLRVDSELEQSQDSWLPEGYAISGRHGTIPERDSHEEVRCRGQHDDGRPADCRLDLAVLQYGVRG